MTDNYGRSLLLSQLVSSSNQSLRIDNSCTCFSSVGWMEFKPVYNFLPAGDIHQYAQWFAKLVALADSIGFGKLVLISLQNLQNFQTIHGKIPKSWNISKYFYSLKFTFLLKIQNVLNPSPNHVQTNQYLPPSRLPQKSINKF